MQKSGIAALAGSAGLAAMVAAGAWWWPTTPDKTATGRMARNDRPPVILYLIDTLRADRLGAYGHRGNTSPVFDALAAESVLFEQAYGPAPWTLPSVASLFTSSFACEHGVTRYKRKLNTAIPTLAERLGALGYDTASFYSNIHSGAVAELNRGFRIAQDFPASNNDRSSDTAAFLATSSRKPYFLFLHTMEPHGWFSTPSQFMPDGQHVSIDDRETLRAIWFRHNELRSWDWAREQPIGSTDNGREQRAIARFLTAQQKNVQLLYDASVRHADRNLGTVINTLRESGEWDRAIFIVLADHGEELGEHGGWFHDHAIYEEQLRVPLLVHFPRSEFAGRRVREPVSLVDVMPTLLDWLGAAERCTDCRGRSLLPLLDRGKDADEPAGGDYIPALRMNEFMFDADNRKARGETNLALRRGDWKGIWNADLGRLELYDLAKDAGEQNDLSRQEGALATDMSEFAERWLAACSAPDRSASDGDPLDDSVLNRLKALGYIR